MRQLWYRLFYRWKSLRTNWSKLHVLKFQFNLFLLKLWSHSSVFTNHTITKFTFRILIFTVCCILSSRSWRLLLHFNGFWFNKYVCFIFIVGMFLAFVCEILLGDWRAYGWWSKRNKFSRYNVFYSACLFKVTHLCRF